MRILMLNFEKGWRGGERQTLLTMHEFRKAGHEVALLARRDGELATAALQAGFLVYQESGVAGLCRCLLRHRKRFDIFHAQTANTVTWLAILKPVLNGITVFTRRTAFPVTRRPALTAWKWKQIDVLVAISHAAASGPSGVGVPVRHVIPSAVIYKQPDEVAIAALRQQYSPDGRCVIATAAAFTVEKDPLTLVQAVHHLRQQRDDFVFLHFGGTGPLHASARQRVHELGLQDYYIFAGFHENIADAYRLMDVFVISSRQEALGSVVLDAFLYGVPVVSTSAGGLKEVLGDGRGMLCPVGDSQCLAQGMLRLLDSPALRKDTVKRAQEYVRREHDVHRMAQRYLDAYAQAMQEKGITVPS